MITFASNIPLIGGLPLGGEIAVGSPPEFVSGYNGFGAHDRQYMNWLNNTNDHKVAYHNLDESKIKLQADIVLSCPPCAGLSMMNASSDKSKSGTDAAANQWMYRSLVDNIDRLGAKVIITENAPALYTERGAGVAANLIKLATERGYSVTLYKTTTKLHGIPQDRIRTFFFAWKSKHAPKLEWFNKPHDVWHEYITKDISDLHQTTYFNPDLVNYDGYFPYMKHIGLDPRKSVIEGKFSSTFDYCRQNGLLDDVIKFYTNVAGAELKLKRATHAKNKFANNKGIWDSSVLVSWDMFNAFVGRNAWHNIHPYEDRGLSIREGLHMMGMPKNFELLGTGTKAFNMVCQNVPTCTAADMVSQAVKFIKGDLDTSKVTVSRQNNIKQFTEIRPGFDI